MRLRLSAASALIATAVGTFALAACGRQVSVPPPESRADICAQVALPASIAGAGSRPTSEPDTAAWGEPPITYRCGVSRPAALDPTSKLLEVSGIGWLPLEASGGTAFIAVTWPSSSPPVYVEVLVPDAYAAPADVLADLSPALATAD
ncbi:MAG: DUF3515 family protein [Candidatus Nanopelagicales bacterium]